MKNPFFKNIVWAVDTLEVADFQQNAQFLLGSLTRETSAHVWPVHILSYPFANAKSATSYEEAYQALAEKRLKILSENSDITQMKNGRVLVNRLGTIRAAVDVLLDYANGIDADAIVVSTHSKGAVAKLFLGSFAETLLLQSPIPVLTVNPHSKVREKVSNVLFPTTFDASFIVGFKKTLDLCANLGANLTLYYKEPFIPMLEASQELYNLMAKEAADRKKQAEGFRDMAQQRHIPVEVRLESSPGNVANEISEYANRHNIDLIVMVSETSEFDGPRVGSICRKVVRNADAPVWTLKTDKEEVASEVEGE